MQERSHSLSVVLGMLMLAGLLSSVAVAAYDIEDLSGTWSVHGLVAGAAPNVPGAYYATATANTSGSITETDYTDTLGNTAASWADNTQTFDLSGGGILTVAGTEAPFRGVMNWEEDFIVAVGTVTPGPDTGLTGQNLWTLVKQSPTPVFSQSDAAGTWWMHGLYVDNDSSGSWSRGQLEVTAAGNVSFVPGTFQNGDGDANTPPDGTVSVTSYGYVGFSYDPDMHGIMNLDKDLIVFTMPEDTGGNLSILQKRSGATFSSADMVGNWHVYDMVLEVDRGSAVWDYGMLEVAADGSILGQETNSYGQSDTFGGTLSIDSSGVVTLAEEPSMHGTMSDDKDMVVITSGDASDSYNLIILVRAEVSPMYRFWSASNLRHFYTLSLADKYYIETTWPDAWTYETEAYFAFAEDSQPGLMPVYRFWSPTLLAHFYTISEADKNYIQTNWSDTWTYEEIAFYAYPPGSPPAGSKPVYRFWSPTLLTHFYTISEADKNYIEATWPDAWEYEEIAWYAYE